MERQRAGANMGPGLFYTSIDEGCKKNQDIEGGNNLITPEPSKQGASNDEALTTKISCRPHLTERERNAWTMPRGCDLKHIRTPHSLPEQAQQAQGSIKRLSDGEFTQRGLKVARRDRTSDGSTDMDLEFQETWLSMSAAFLCLSCCTL